VYGLTIAISILICTLVAEYLAKKENKNTDILWGSVFYTIVSGVIGARIYHVIDRWDYYELFPTRIFYLWNGGLGIIGGIILGGSALYIYLYMKKQDVLSWMDLGALVAPIGQALGRWGNVFNNELIPLAYYEMALDWILFVTLILVYKKRASRPKGLMLSMYLAGYALIRTILHPFR